MKEHFDYERDELVARMATAQSVAESMHRTWSATIASALSSGLLLEPARQRYGLGVSQGMARGWTGWPVGRFRGYLGGT